MDIQKLPAYSPVLVALLKAPVYANDERNWKLLLAHADSIKKYFSQLGVRLYLNEIEGFAFLQALSEEEKEDYKAQTGEDLPNLISQRKLSYTLTMLLVLLRKKLLDLDAQGEETRLILTRQELKDSVSLFLPDTNDQVKQSKTVETNIRTLLKMGILRQLENRADTYEVNRILNAKITPVELDRIHEILKDYGNNEEKE